MQEGEVVDAEAAQDDRCPLANTIEPCDGVSGAIPIDRGLLRVSNMQFK